MISEKGILEILKKVIHKNIAVFGILLFLSTFAARKFLNQPFLNETFLSFTLLSYINLITLMSGLIIFIYFVKALREDHQKSSSEISDDEKNKPNVKTKTKEFMKLIEKNKTQIVDSKVFIAQAKLSRENEDKSIHVLYATADSISLYYSKATRDWVTTESLPANRTNRKRLIIIENDAMSCNIYRDELSRIVEKFSVTSELKILFDTDLIDNQEYYELVRDFGIFTNKEDAIKQGFFTFISYLTHKIFSQVPNSYYIVEDYQYLSDLENKFNLLWYDTDFQVLYEERKNIMKNCINNISRNVYQWAISESILTKDSLNALNSNEIPAIRIQHFATDDECKRLLDTINNYHKKINDYTDISPTIEHLGKPLYEYRDKPISEYLKVADKNQHIYSAITREAQFDPIKRMLSILDKQCGIEARIAFEKDNHEYFAGIIRIIENSALLHVDFAPMDAKGFNIEKIKNQIAWNLFLTTPERGGECIVYDSPWCDDYETCHLANSYGYTPALVKGEKRFSIKAITGDVVLFNCRNLHEVRHITGKRITIGSFIGETQESDYILWS